MKAIILAGGKGTRLYPVTLETPKPLLTVRKKPIINYLVELFWAHGIKEIGIAISSAHREDFDWWYKRWWHDYPIRFFEEEEALGSFGALANAAQWLEGEDFFVTNGDELKRFDLALLENAHRTHGAVATIALVEVENPQDYGVAEIDGHHIVRFLEKPQDPPTRLINSGLWCISPAIFAYYDRPKGTFARLEDEVFPQLAAEKKLIGVPYQAPWFDCGTLERWQKAIEEWPELI